jgi:hypothetical protein
LANKFLREFPQELALVPGGVFGFKATLLEAASRGDTKAMGQLAESMARPFYSPVQSFKENPAGTVLMWAMVGGTYAERLRAQVKASNEVERRALEAFADMMAEQRAGVRQGRSASPLHDQARAIQVRAAGQSARFQGMADEVAGKTGGRAVVVPTKTVENMVGKAMRTNPADPGAVLSEMKDVLRASIVMPDWESCKAAARELASRASEIDNSLIVPKESGYKGLHFTIDLGDGVRAEVQLHTEETYALAHGPEGTHGLYEGVRDVLHLPSDQVPPERRAQVDEYLRVVAPRYAAVKIPADVTSEVSSLRPSGPGSERWRRPTR